MTRSFSMLLQDCGNNIPGTLHCDKTSLIRDQPHNRCVEAVLIQPTCRDGELVILIRDDPTELLLPASHPFRALLRFRRTLSAGGDLACRRTGGSELLVRNECVVCYRKIVHYFLDCPLNSNTGEPL